MIGQWTRLQTAITPARMFPGSDGGRALARADIDRLREPPLADSDTMRLRQTELLLREMQHRVGNSLQVIACILLLKARETSSEEVRAHLQDAHRRIMAVAAVQQQVDSARLGEEIEVGPYLSRLCENLAVSLVEDVDPVAFEVRADSGLVASSQAVSIGLIVTELAINALKHAFPAGTRGGRVVVSYERAGTDWLLTVSDNGVGIATGAPADPLPGQGTDIVEALARQLRARVERSAGPGGAGTSVSVAHGAGPSRAARGQARLREQALGDAADGARSVNATAATGMHHRPAPSRLP